MKNKNTENVLDSLKKKLEETRWKIDRMSCFPEDIVRRIEKKYETLKLLWAQVEDLKKINNIILASNLAPIDYSWKDLSGRNPELQKQLEKSSWRNPVGRKLVKEIEKGIPETIQKADKVFNAALMEKTRVKNLNRIHKNLCAYQKKLEKEIEELEQKERR